MWPPIIFLSLMALVLVDFWWHERRFRRRREGAKREFTAQALRQQQQAFAQARAQQEALFNSMTEGVLVLGPEGRVEMFNQSVARLLALPQAARGQSLAHVLHWPELQTLIERAARERQVLGLELEFPGAERRVLRINAAVCAEVDGASPGLVLVLHDITRLQQLEATRQEFVANVSHELRTPLSLIKGFVETLQDGAKDDPVMRDRFLQIIAKHTDRLAFLIDDLLAISRLESGQVKLDCRKLAAREAVARVLDDLRARAAERSVVLENRLPESLSVHADAERLEQVLFNLVENAIKHGRAQGQVRIGAEKTGGGFVEILVSDDGPGIPPEARERVFERFYRVDKARSRESGGTGLGLAIVKHIVLAHGGAVRVESAPGQGATFCFTLPQSDSSGA